jgi:hypothetical protein
VQQHQRQRRRTSGGSGAPARGRRAWPNTVDVDADVVKGGQPLLLGGPIVSVEQWSTKERSTSVSVP